MSLIFVATRLVTPVRIRAGGRAGPGGVLGRVVRMDGLEAARGSASGRYSTGHSARRPKRAVPASPGVHPGDTLNCYKKVWGSSKYEFEEPHDGLDNDGRNLSRLPSNPPRRHPRLHQVALVQIRFFSRSAS